MTRKDLIVFLDSVIESSRKIVIRSIFLLGIFFAASLSYQLKSVVEASITDFISLSSQDALALMQLLLDGALIISEITIALYALLLKTNPANFKDFVLIARRNKMKVFGFITASVLLLLLPYNIITMGVVLFVNLIWRILAEDCERINRCLAKDTYYTMFTTDRIRREDYEALTIGSVSRGKCDVMIPKIIKKQRTNHYIVVEDERGVKS